MRNYLLTLVILTGCATEEAPTCPVQRYVEGITSHAYPESIKPHVYYKPMQGCSTDVMFQAIQWYRDNGYPLDYTVVDTLPELARGVITVEHTYSNLEDGEADTDKVDLPEEEPEITTVEEEIPVPAEEIACSNAPTSVAAGALLRQVTKCHNLEEPKEGQNYVLARAFQMYNIRRTVDMCAISNRSYIHVRPDQCDVLVFAHEIGHTLGLEHSPNTVSVMHGSVSGDTKLWLEPERWDALLEGRFPLYEN